MEAWIMYDKDAPIGIRNRCVTFKLSAADCEIISTNGIWQLASRIGGTRRRRKRLVSCREREKRGGIIRDGPKHVPLPGFLLSNVWSRKMGWRCDSGSLSSRRAVAHILWSYCTRRVCLMRADRTQESWRQKGEGWSPASANLVGAGVLNCCRRD